MADLSTLDSAAPASTDAVGDGDDKIRETRLATKTSFGGTDAGTGTQASEHFLLGPHKFPSGAQAAKPAAGNAGRMFWDTTNSRMERDTGAVWVKLAADQLTATSNQVGTVISNPLAFATVATRTINIAAGSALLVLASAQVAADTDPVSVKARLQVGGVTMAPASLYDHNYYLPVRNLPWEVDVWGYIDRGTLNPGNHTITFDLQPGYNVVAIGVPWAVLGISLVVVEL